MTDAPGTDWGQRLEAAIAAAHPRCVEWGNDRVTVEYRPAYGDFIPVSHHFAKTPCPAPL